MRLNLLFTILFIAWTAISIPCYRSAWAQSASSAQKERVHQLILMRFASGMGLNNEETQQLDQILRRNQSLKSQRKKELQAAQIHLREVTASGNKSTVEQALDTVRTAQKKLDSVDEAMFQEVKGLFDAEQIAQFVLIMDEIRREVRSVQRRSRDEADEPSQHFDPRNRGYYEGNTSPPYLWVP